MSPPSEARHALVLMRHGESAANRADRFTGRLDPPLTARGRLQAVAAGRCLAGHGLIPAHAFVSPLLRTVATCALVLNALGQPGLRAEPCPALVERHYGALTGLDRAEAEAHWGAECVRRWRRSYTEAPPDGESLRDTVARVVSGYLREILPAAMRGTTLVVAHGNSLRALVMALEGMTPAEVEELELPTGALRLYRLAADTSVLSRSLLETDLVPEDGWW
ncbi:2,3-bisphosphoglycerate-dependent phosphoglycerate mutase [uncultured Methylobacterium sp.]|uniref:2,3-bisphosphoglycerate-dependent phosphoglycerate mutase n=1 Tax=uncultured Methylobacterium sp. TaxID=157278 RepID=UPI002598F9CB|nr:2,3-bisphosphoglycerate-dependent phosphoglycerate mutase [uncultured Methylobacterium sp.]